ncbi:MAG: flagellar biosynthesis protein FlhF [Bacillus sp. (in: firmicutes)]
MKIKKFNAPSMNQAMEQIRAEFGKDAFILNSKVIHSGGFLGFFKKKSIEVIAGIDPQATRKQAPPLKEKMKKEHVPAVPQESGRQADSPVKEETLLIRDRQLENAVLQEITDLKRIVKNINADHNAAMLNGDMKEMADVLKSQEIDSEIVADLILMLKEVSENEAISYGRYTELAKEYLLSRLSVSPDSIFKKKYVNVVGPTGVGKTTTLAKLAAESALKHQKKVAFITTDTYRIAAIDQLQTYAKILNVPIEVAYNLEDFRKAAERFSHYDLVFIDTAGRNFRNPGYVSDLRKIISFDDDMETYLVLALTSKQKDMEMILQQFSLLSISHFIFTKMDETASYGAMYNLMAKSKINTAFITNGQDVPDDIMEATPGKIIDMVLGVGSHEGSG